ncbi:UNVERIFIED_CONTAM: hypothetical protein HDU68_009354 [Siphonaria sp. JEL0065]|nr:hypothetical protein HDU68_009354 [Siphonaria sp. JEL0065]
MQLVVLFGFGTVALAQTTTSSAALAVSSTVSSLLPTAVTTCFDCKTAGCQNYGNCTSLGVCSCLPGYGGRDCLTPLCNSILVSNNQRSTLPSGQDVCTCDKGFSGPTCAVCANDSVCPQGTSSGISVTVNQVCNKSPVTWNQQNSYCALVSPLLQTLYKAPTSIVLDRNSTNMFGSLWYNNAEQFMCSLSDCSQSITNGIYTNKCNTGSCSCSGNSAFCGGPGVVFNIQDSLKAASGGSVFSCNVDGTNCNLYFDFLKSLFPEGMPLSDCSFGECAYANQNPYLVNTNSNPISPAGIAGIIIGSVFILGTIIVFGWSLIYQIHARKQPIPPPCKGATIQFSDICYTLPTGQNLLTNITSSASAGQLTAILGPSGAGKSTLLDILAGKEKRGKITGSLTFDGVPFNAKDSKHTVAYVDQDDLLLPSLTVRETLLFSARLRLAEGMTDKEKAEQVDQVIETLGLSHVANTRVGGFGMRGISGGERRRVSIGVELVTSPGILFLDEPTSGLDSYNAHAVIEALHNLAHVHHKTVVFTVHQPRSDVFAMFDQVIVLAAGAILYAGRGVDTAAQLRQQGAPCPEGYNLADHLLDLAMEESKKSDGDHIRDRSNNAPSFLINIGGKDGGVLRKRTNVPKLDSQERTLAESGKTPVVLEHVAPVPTARVGFLTQLSELIRRSYRHLIRTPSLFFGHIGISIVMGIFVGGVYFHSDSSISGVQNRLGSLFFVLSLVGFSSLSAIGSLAQERNLFIRERSNGVYGSMPYYISKLVSDILPLRVLPAFLTGTIAFFMVGYDTTGDHYPKFLVMLLLFSAIMGLTCLSLGVLMSDVGTATLAGAILILFKMLFAGLIISQDSIPKALQWIQYLSFFRYPYEGMAVNDLGLLQIQDTFDGSSVNLPAALILEKFGFKLDNYGQDLLITIVLMVVLVAVTGLLIDVRLKERR